MPLIDIQVMEGVFSDDEKARMIEEVTKGFGNVNPLNEYGFFVLSRFHTNPCRALRNSVHSGIRKLFCVVTLSTTERR